MDLSIIIVNYNGEAILKNCLDSIAKSKFSSQLEVILVDNASKDASKDVLMTWAGLNPEVILKTYYNQDNVGFAKANNQGATLATGEWLLLLNNDTILDPNALQILLDFAKTEPKLGLAGPALFHVDGRSQAQGSALGQMQYVTKKPKPVGFIIGAVMLIRKALYLEVGGFDENYVFYNEDVDLCKTLQKKGYKNYFVPEAKVTHIGGFSSRTMRPDAIREGFRGGLYLVNKHYPKPVFFLYRGIVLLWASIQVLRLSLLCLVMKSKVPYRNTFAAIVRIAATNQLVSPKGRF